MKMSLSDIMKELFIDVELHWDGQMVRMPRALFIKLTKQRSKCEIIDCKIKGMTLYARCRNER